MEPGDGDGGTAVDEEQVSLLRATVEELRAMLEAERAQSRSVPISWRAASRKSFSRVSLQAPSAQTFF